MSLDPTRPTWMNEVLFTPITCLLFFFVDENNLRDNVSCSFLITNCTLSLPHTRETELYQKKKDSSGTNVQSLSSHGTPIQHNFKKLNNKFPQLLS